MSPIAVSKGARRALICLWLESTVFFLLSHDLAAAAHAQAMQEGRVGRRDLFKWDSSTNGPFYEVCPVQLTSWPDGSPPVQTRIFSFVGAQHLAIL